jgi:hypothetical protein
MNRDKVASVGSAPPRAAQLRRRFNMLRAIALTVLSLWAVVTVGNDTDTDCSKPFLVTVAADGGCNVSKVVVACESVGSLLRSMGLRVDCEVRVAGDPFSVTP